MDNAQFIYLILIIPGIFGITLFADGIYKVMKGQENALITTLFGIMFLAVVVFSYFFFSTYLAPQI